MRSLSAPMLAALAAPQLTLVQLVLMAFPTPVALNTSTWDLTWGGVVYKGAGALGAINTIEDSPGEIKGLSLTLAGIDSAYIALALDDAAAVQGTPLTIRTAVLDANYQVVDAPVEWDGRLDTMTIEEDGETCSITATAESSAVDLLRGSALTYSDADQRSLQPGDAAFQYVVPQANTPVIWPTKDWFIAFGRR